MVKKAKMQSKIFENLSVMFATGNEMNRI